MRSPIIVWRAADRRNRIDIGHLTLSWSATFRDWLGMAQNQTSAIDTKIGERVRVRRLMLGLSEERLAGALGLTLQQIRKYEKGLDRIGVSRLVQIAQILRIPLRYFFMEFSTAAEGKHRQHLPPSTESGS
jgi:ribosome-binding protein aMBF1 (putative translation factor)